MSKIRGITVPDDILIARDAGARPPYGLKLIDDVIDGRAKDVYARCELRHPAVEARIVLDLESSDAEIRVRTERHCVPDDTCGDAR